MSRFWVVLYSAAEERQRVVILEAEGTQAAIHLAEARFSGWEAIAAGLQRGAR
jgi:hypothetical protein